MQINIIAAVARDLAIGFENKLLYWLPNDLKRFKSLTTGHTIVMGRKTFDSLPKGALPNRRNVVLSRSVTELPGAEVFSDLNSALASCSPDEEVYIIGGESIYREAISFAHRLCLTEIDAQPDKADAYFPEFSLAEWKETFSESHETDEKHAYSYRFVDYERI
ncbi:MAG: dihydrofolate reductase [Bacteroidaceae bacterium]|nr:dihydrofolate reductase [Bacteroidaceae bacterium]